MKTASTVMTLKRVKTRNMIKKIFVRNFFMKTINLKTVLQKESRLEEGLSVTFTNACIN